MSKYIDADKLKAEIDNLESFSCISEEQDGFYSAISRINDLIDSLQQEQPGGGCSGKPNDLLSEPEAFSCSHENDNEPPQEATSRPRKTLR